MVRKYPEYRIRLYPFLNSYTAYIWYEIPQNTVYRSNEKRYMHTVYVIYGIYGIYTYGIYGIYTGYFHTMSLTVLEIAKLLPTPTVILGSIPWSTSITLPEISHKSVTQLITPYHNLSLLVEHYTTYHKHLSVSDGHKWNDNLHASRLSIGKRSHDTCPSFGQHKRVETKRSESRSWQCVMLKFIVLTHMVNSHPPCI